MSEPSDIGHTITATRETVMERRVHRLTVVAGADQGLTHDFDSRVRIGTRPFADLVVHDPKVSGLHCELAVEGALRVRDLDSKNGVFIDGVRIYDALLPLEAALSIGDSRLKVQALDVSTRTPLHDDDEMHGIVGASAAMRAVMASISKIGSTDATVLVTGETGSGKELVAHALHASSARRAGPFVVIDCGAIAGNLIESELFGHERGAFTGADVERAGAFERAQGGTLFLDEIGELPMELQSRLLRAVESRKVRRVGAAREIELDVRIIAATHRDLAREVARARFREDLYYRLAVVSLRLPALRERLADLPLLAAHLVAGLGADPRAILDGAAIAELRAHDWPGNVRELRNVLERAIAMREPIAVVAPTLTTTGAAADLDVPLKLGRQRVIDAYERAYLTALLTSVDGNISEAARQAGIDRVSFYRLLSRLGIERSASASPTRR